MPVSQDGPSVSVRQLTKRYGNNTVVDHVSFDIGQHEIFSLLGPNGAGKTTTIRMLTTAASITEGSASVAGRDVERTRQQFVAPSVFCRRRSPWTTSLRDPESHACGQTSSCRR